MAQLAQPITSKFVGDPSSQGQNAPTPPASNYNSRLDVTEEDKTSEDEQQKKEKFLQLAKKRFKLSAEAEMEQRSDALDDQKFRVGDQWPFEVKSRRDQDGRPCLTVNRIPQFLRQVTNEQRQNRPGIQINPIGDGADVKTAEVIEGLIRHIESNDADIAYDTAFDFAAATGGPGAIRVMTDYVDENSFDQEIKIVRVMNPMTVYWDPNSQDPAGRDLNWVFIVEDLTKEEFEAQYPDKQPSGFYEAASIGDKSNGWVTEKHIRVAEYWYVDQVEKDLLLFADGTTAFSDEVDDTEQRQIVTSRKALQRKVKWAKMTAMDVLDERTDYRGKYIPIIPVIGDETVVDGKKKLSGVVRFAKDPQRAYNYWTSAETEMIALAPKAPYIVEAGQVEGYENIWKNLNTKNYTYLPYKGKSLGDKPIPAPSRAQWEPPIQAISMARAQANDDLKATTGLYDASLGARGNETSGRAILARQREGDVANFHLSDNLARSIRHVGRIILDLIPYIYDAPRVARIIGREEKQRLVTIQSSRDNPDIQPPAQDQQGDNSGNNNDDINRIYDVGVGKYDVAVTVGPSFNTKRQEAVESMLSLTQNFPQLVQIAGDLLVKNMDWPGADEISKRLKKMLPPQLQDEEDDPNKQQVQIPPAMKQQIDQLLQQHDQLTQINQQLLDEREKRILELASREKIAAMQAQVQVLLAQTKIESAESIKALEHGAAKFQAILDYSSAVEQAGGENPQSMAPAPAQTQQPQPGPQGPAPSPQGSPPGI